MIKKSYYDRVEVRRDSGDFYLCQNCDEGKHKVIFRVKDGFEGEVHPSKHWLCRKCLKQITKDEQEKVVFT